VAKLIAILMLAWATTLLTGCARDAFVETSAHTSQGSWRIARQFDRVTSADLASATTFAEASNTNVVIPKMSSLQLTCFERRPLIRFAFDFKIGSNNNTELGYRFDDKPGVESTPARVLDGRQIIVIEEPFAVAGFVRDLKDARKLYVRIRAISLGRTSVEYDLEGSAAALQAGFAACPVATPPKA
jgi:hypothetical protein